MGREENIALAPCLGKGVKAKGSTELRDNPGASSRTYLSALRKGHSHSRVGRGHRCEGQPWEKEDNELCSTVLTATAENNIIIPPKIKTRTIHSMTSIPLLVCTEKQGLDQYFKMGDLECSPEAHKGSVLSLWHYWKGVETSGDGANGRKSGHWGPFLLFSVCFLGAMR